MSKRKSSICGQRHQLKRHLECSSCLDDEVTAELDEPPIGGLSEKPTSKTPSTSHDQGVIEHHKKGPSDSKSKASIQLGLTKILLVLIAQLPVLAAYPMRHNTIIARDVASSPTLKTTKVSQFWVNMSVSIVLVLLGGVFAGLTLGLMGQDEVYVS